MNDIEFENFEIKIEVYDQNEFKQNLLVGQHSIGLSTLYRNPNHEIFNSWLPLFHPSEDLKSQGFLLVSAYIIGEGDRPPVHEVGENVVEDEPDEFKGLPDDQLTGEQLQRRREKKKQIAIVSKPDYYNKKYQLMVNIVKAEDLPILTGGSMDWFIDFVSVRVNGITQITTVIKNMQKPQFKTRLMFPLQFPLNNDKIVIRIWDKRVCLTDTFIAQIPEVPTENDFFSLTFLQSRGGVLPFSWFNLYGIPLDERPSDFEANFLGYKKMALGTAYMGKLLLSLNLTPSEKPEKSVLPLGVFREPPISRYMIRLDAYEISEAKDCGEFVTIRVRAGGQYVETKPAYPKKQKTKQQKSKADVEPEKKTDGVTYAWKEKEIMVDLKTIEVTENVEQHPNILIELYNDQKKRVAFLRIPGFSKDFLTEKPLWYHLKQVKYKTLTDLSEPTHSYALLNVMFRPEVLLNGIPRIAVKRNIQGLFLFYCYMYAGYDLCPELYSEEVELEYELKLGEEKQKSTKFILGKNPIWNELKIMPASLDENLEFASNILFTFYNRKQKSGLFTDKQEFECSLFLKQSGRIGNSSDVLQS